MKIGSLNVGRVGVGAWQAGGRAWIVDFRELEKAYNYAFDHGVRFVDTAEIYGGGKSEEFVGRLVKDRPEIVVATKVAGFHWGRVLKSAEASRRRLGRIDLLQLHWPPPIYVPLCRAVRELEKAANAGFTHEIGVSNFDVKLMNKAVYCTKKWELVSDQVVYNPLQRGAESLIDAGRRLGFVVISWSPLARGAAVKEKLNNDPARRIGSVVKPTPQSRAVVECIKKIAERRSTTPAVVVLAWHVAKGAFPIPGVKNVAQARDVVESQRFTLTEREIAEIDQVSKPFINNKLLTTGARAVPAFLQKLVFSFLKI